MVLLKQLAQTYREVFKSCLRTPVSSYADTFAKY